MKRRRYTYQDINRAGIPLYQATGASDNASTKSESKMSQRRVPEGSTMSFRNFGKFSADVRKQVQELNYESGELKITYVNTLVDFASQGGGIFTTQGVVLTRNINSVSGTGAINTIVGASIMPQALNIYYRFVRRWHSQVSEQNRVPCINGRLVTVQWLDDEQELNIDKVLVNPGDLPGAPGNYFMLYNNPIENENFNKLCDRKKFQPPLKTGEYELPQDNPFRAVIANGVIKISKTQLTNVVFNGTEVQPGEPPVKGALQLFFVSDEPVQTQGPTQALSCEFITELKYLDTL